MTGDGLVLVCTDRGTHEKAECELTVPPVTTAPASGRERNWKPPMFVASRLRLPEHMEARCSECGRTLRLGRRNQERLTGAGLAEIDISRMPY
jgi:hypothetical protein